MDIKHARDEDHLQKLLGKRKHAPSMVCYHRDCVNSSRLLREIRQTAGTTPVEGVSVIMVNADRFPPRYLMRRGLNRLPAVAYFSGVFEVERLTGFSYQDSILRGLNRLHDRIATEAIPA